MPSRVRLFCFPYAGGGPWIYRGWTAHVPSFIEVCPVHLPGRGQRIGEPLLTSIPDLVNAVADELGDGVTTPFALFGHSMGAIIGFELARTLRERFGVWPTHVFVSGRRAPQQPAHGDRITYNLPEPEFRTVVRDLEGMSPALIDDTEAWQLLMPILRADFQAVQTYAYQRGAPLPCPISAIGGLDDPHVTRGDLAAWQEHSSGAFHVSLFPGAHLFINQLPADVCHLVATRLARTVMASTGADL